MITDAKVCRNTKLSHWLALIIPVAFLMLLDAIFSFSGALKYLIFSVNMCLLWAIITKFITHCTCTINHRGGGLTRDEMKEILTDGTLTITQKNTLLSELNDKENTQLLGRNILEGSIKVGTSIIIGTAMAIYIIFGV